MSQNWTPPPSAGGSPTIPNYMVMAVLSVVCFWPISIAAIIFATQVNKKIAEGDIPGAEESSRKAKLFSYIAIGVGLVGWVIGIVLSLLVFGLAAANS